MECKLGYGGVWKPESLNLGKLPVNWLGWYQLSQSRECSVHAESEGESQGTKKMRVKYKRANGIKSESETEIKFDEQKCLQQKSPVLLGANMIRFNSPHQSIQEIWRQIHSRTTEF